MCVLWVEQKLDVLEEQESKVRQRYGILSPEEQQQLRRHGQWAEEEGRRGGQGDGLEDEQVGGRRGSGCV